MKLVKKRKAVKSNWKRSLKRSVLPIIIFSMAPMLAFAGVGGWVPASGSNVKTEKASNPGVMDGRLTAPGSGESGSDEYYSVSLSKGDSITLSINDFTEANRASVDLDLYLYDTDGRLVASSVGDGEYETISNVPFSGEYVINVHAEAGSSDYNVEVGAELPEIENDALSSTREFVPGEVIVRFSDQRVGNGSGDDMRAHISSMGMELKSGKPGKEVLASMDMDETEGLFQHLDVPDHMASLNAVDNKTQEAVDTLIAIKALRSRSDVISADPNYKVQLVYPASTIPNDSYYDSYQWNLEMMELESAWDVTTGSSDVVVAVVDTGVLTSHPDLSGKLTTDGYDFISDTSISNDGDGIDNDPDDPGDSTTAGDASFHGTHVSGIVGAQSNNNVGVAGVGWSTMIMPIRVLGLGGGTTYDVLQGVRYAGGLSNDSGTVPDKTADVINLSLGSSYYSSTEESVYEEIRDSGIIIVAAAGNDATSSPLYPAAYDSVVSVAAVGVDGDRASYSNYGGYVDVAAPGGDIYDGTTGYILSTGGDLESSGNIDLTYVFMAGTSMAAPHVAGVAALMKAVDSGMSPEDFDDYISSGDITDYIDDTDLYSYGLINAYEAVSVVGGNDDDDDGDDGGDDSDDGDDGDGGDDGDDGGDDSDDGDDGDDDDEGNLTVSPTSLDFGTNTRVLNLTVSNSGLGDVAVTDVATDASWLFVIRSSVDHNGIGTYTVVANRLFLSSGTYSAEITITSDSNTVTVPVSLTVQKGGSPGGGGPGGGGRPGRW